MVQKLRCKRILDIGKGFGKYGFLIHEYCGIDNQRKINNEQTLKDQSTIRIDAAEIDADLMLPHLSQIYHEVYFGDIFENYERLEDYDLILMVDVIEHLDKEKSISMINYFFKKIQVSSYPHRLNFLSNIFMRVFMKITCHFGLFQILKNQEMWMFKKLMGERSICYLRKK